MSDGLTLNEDSIKVYLNGTEVLAKVVDNENETVNYTITFKSKNETVNGFVITFESTSPPYPMLA